MSTPVMRPARKGESRVIAELFEIASDGVAGYIWSTLQGDYRGLPPLEIGRLRYERESTAFSYQNCLMAEDQGQVLGMLHSFPAEPRDGGAAAPQAIDSVLQPYSELEAPGTLYIAAIAVRAGFRNQGIGARFLAAARERARQLGRRELSLLCFAGNTGARRLYERQGFVVADWRPVVPHPLIRHTGDVLLMLAPV
ncbi:MAG TPA: GNAT family N-acetyltransferase [Geminicoccaceae bacterium]|nr:GNAT family N-acetyltransferase [Geminicoccaceae bacterium]